MPPSEPPVSCLSEHVGFQLRLAQMVSIKDLTNALAPLGLKPTDFSVLALIGSQPGLKQQTVGEILRIQRPNMVSLLDSMESRGLIIRGPVANDRRSHALTLTPDGERLLEKAHQVHDEHDNRLSIALAGIEKSVLLEALSRIAAMQPYPSADAALSKENDHDVAG